MEIRKFISQKIKTFGIIALISFGIHSQAVDVTTTQTTTTVEQFDTISVLYFAMFNRIPDGEGLAFWQNKVISEGWSIQQVAQSFFDQEETKALYPELYVETPDRVELITQIYQNLFNRYPDGSGLEYWDRELLLGTITPSLFLLAIINGVGEEDRSFILGMEDISVELSSNGIVDQENFREVLDILFENGLSTAMDFIVYLSHESDISYLKPTLSFSQTPTKESISINISTVDASAQGLDIAMFNGSTNQWSSIGQKVLDVGSYAVLSLSNIADGTTIEIRFQNKAQTIISGSSSLLVEIPTAKANLADSDGDGILDRGDFFPNDPTESIDSDGDGIGNNADLCDDTAKGAEIDEDGCSPNTPAIITGELSGVITEGDEAITRSLTITDPDEGEDVMIAKNISGNYGEFSLTSDGTWTYVMTADLERAVSQNDDFTVSSKDGVAAEIRVTVIGADNNTTE